MTNEWFIIEPAYIILVDAPMASWMITTFASDSLFQCFQNVAV